MSQRRTPTPNRPIRPADLDDAWVSFSKGERFDARDLMLGELGGSVKIGISITELPPGKQSCPFHAHQIEEEHFYVLEGRCVLRSGDERFEMRAGDYVCFPPGTGVAHCFLNPFSERCRFLTIGDRSEHEVCTYPDSGNVLVRSLRKMVRLPAEPLDYWDGEPVDEPLEG